MTPEFAYRSDIFSSLPDNSGYLGIYISENRCDIAVCSSAFVLCLFHTYTKPSELDQSTFLRQIFAENQSLFATHFQEVNISVQGNQFVLLPTKLNIDADEALGILTNVDDCETFHHATPIHDCRITFAVTSSIIAVINNSFENPRILHPAAFIIDQSLTAQQADGVLVFDEEHFDLVVKKEGTIHSVNRHQFETAEDVSYFTLLALKDANLEPRNTNLIVSGKIARHEDVHMNLLKFINTVEVKSLQTSVSMRSDFDQSPHLAEQVLNVLHANY